MKKINTLLAVVIMVLAVSCGNNEKQNETAATQLTPEQLAAQQEQIAQIKTLEAQIHDAEEVDNTLANEAIKLYSDFATAFPDDTLAPEYLFKAGEVATAAKKYKRALDFYQVITQKYPQYKHTMQSLYLQGFLFDNFLNDDASAKTVYEEIIAKYPNTTYAKDAKSAIDNLGKSDEQIIKEFEEKNK